MKFIASILKLGIYASFWIEYKVRPVAGFFKKIWKWAVKAVDDYHKATSELTPEERYYLDQDTNLFI